jgi:hypothetical protein
MVSTVVAFRKWRCCRPHISVSCARHIVIDDRKKLKICISIALPYKMSWNVFSDSELKTGGRQTDRHTHTDDLS